MAHSILHLAIGLTLGTIYMLATAPVIFVNQEPASRHLRKCLLLTAGLAIWSVMPNLCRRVGLPESFCAGWWMNIFFLHPFLDSVKTGGKIFGVAWTALCFAFYYVVLLVGIRNARSLNKVKSQPSP